MLHKCQGSLRVDACGITWACASSARRNMWLFVYFPTLHLLNFFCKIEVVQFQNLFAQLFFCCKFIFVFKRDSDSQ